MYLFKTKKVFLESFMIQFHLEKYPIHWILEGFPDNFHETTNWVNIYEQNKTDTKQVHFELQTPSVFSCFKFTMIGNNSVNSHEPFLEKFNLFGNLVDPLNSLSLL
jgi:hypothetical protein